MMSTYAEAPARQPSPVWHAEPLPSRRVRRLVEAAGVEPASEIAVSQECPCSVRFRMFSPAGLRTDKMADKLVRLISPIAARTEPLKPAY